MPRAGFVVVLVLAVGCGSGAPPPLPAATPAALAATAAPPTTATPPPSIVPRILPVAAQPARVPPVAFQRLMALLPAVNGWTRRDDRGELLSNPIVTARAEATYERDDSHVELEIADSAREAALLAPMAVFLAPGYAERSDGGFRRAAQIDGQPAFEEWREQSRRGEIALLVASRFIVRATGHGIDTLDTVRSVVDAVNVSALAALR